MLKINMGKELMATQPKLVINETIKQNASVYDALEALQMKPKDEVIVLQSFYEAPFTTEKFRRLVLRVAIGACTNVPEALESDMWQMARILFRNGIFKNVFVAEVCRNGLFALIEDRTLFHIACGNVRFIPKYRYKTDGVYFCEYDPEKDEIGRISEAPLHHGAYDEEENGQEE